MENQTTTPPDPTEVTFPVSDDVRSSGDVRAVVLTEWISRVRAAGHPGADYLSPGYPKSDLAEGKSLHCGTARIGRALYDVYLTTTNKVTGGRLNERQTRARLGLAPPQLSGADGAEVSAAITTRAEELQQLIDRARHVQHDHPEIGYLADAVVVIAALLPAFANLGVSPDVEYHLDRASGRLDDIVDELEPR